MSKFVIHRNQKNWLHPFDFQYRGGSYVLNLTMDITSPLNRLLCLKKRFILVPFVFIGLLQQTTETFGQASPLPNPTYQSPDQRSIVVTFNQAITGSATASDWSVTLGGTPVGIQSVTRISATTVRVLFTPSTVNGVGVNYILPGQLVQISFTNISGSLTTVVGGAPVNGTGGAITAVNNYIPSCGDIDFLSRGFYSANDVCAPVDMNFFRWTYEVSLVYRNSSAYAGNIFFLSVAWGDGFTSNTNSVPSDNLGGATPTFASAGIKLSTQPVAYATIKPTHTYPATYSLPAPASCEFIANLTPFFSGLGSCGSKIEQQLFPSYDTDNKNTGALNLPEFVPGSKLVCLGNNVGMMFNDATNLNCRAAVEANAANDLTRNIRIIYGSQNYAGGNIPNVFVTLPASLGGATVPITNSAGALIAPNYFPTTGSADFNGVINLPASVTAPSGTAFMGTIFTTSPAGQAVGQRLYVKLEYWNICNQYDGIAVTGNQEFVENFIEIITTPPAITFTPNPPNFCESQANSNYLLTQSGGTTGVYNWYSTFPPVVAGDLEKTGSTFNPITEASVPGVVSKTPASTTTTNFFITQTAVNGCESLPTPVPFKIIKNVTGGTITHPGPNPICSGDTPAAFANSVLPTGGDGVGTYTYQWKVSTTSGGPYVNAVGAGATTAGPFTPSAAITQTSFYVREATSGTKAGTGTCTVALSNQITITVHTTPTPGTVTANQTICEVPGDPVNLTQTVAPTGGNGIYTFQWQSATAIGGPYSNIVGATSSNFDPPAGLLVTTFYRRVVTSGFCPVNTAATLPITITVHNIVNSGTIGNTQTICSGQTPVGLTGTPATGGDGSTYFYQWEQSTTGAGGPYSNASGVSTTQNYDPPALITTTHYRRRSTSLTCPSTNSNIIQIAVNPLPTAANPSGGGAVCGGNPAPDIDWALTGTPPFNVTYNQTPGGPVVVTNWPANTFTISAPSPGVNTTYQLTALTDMNGCVATSLGGTASVTIGGSPPAFETLPSLTPTNTCDNGASTTNPQLNFALTLASSVVGNYTLTYQIDGGGNLTKIFSVNTGTGVPTAAITFNEAALNNLLPSPHVIRIVSIVSPNGCLAIIGTNLDFFVNPLPINPTGGVGAVVCSSSATGAQISVADPGAGFAIEWYTNAAATIAATGALSGGRDQNFTPASNATATYFAVTRNTTTSCRSAASLGVIHTQDVSPAAAVAGANQPNVCAGTPSVALAATAATNGGNGSWTIPGRVAYYQNFTNFANGVTSSSSLNGWSVNTSGANVFTGGAGYFRVESNRFEANNTNGSLGGGAGNIGEVVWNSAVIDIASLTSATATVDLINISNDLLAPEDYIQVFYKLNGGPEIAFTTNGNLTGNFLNSTASVSGLVGATLQVVVRVSNDAATNRIAFDNVFVRDASAASITFSDANSPTSTVSNLPAPIPGGVAQTTILRWTVQSALGVCAPTFSNVSITINPLPTAVDPAPVLCETTAGGGSVANVDLTTYNSTVTNTVAVPGTTVQWFSNAARTIPVVGNVTVINGNIFYFRATSPAPFNCVNVGLMTFTINPKPVANAAVYDVCEDSPPGTLQGTIDLTTAAIKTDVIGLSALPAQRNVTWFSSLADAISNTNPVVSPSNFVVTANVQVFARVENTVTGCTNQSTVTLQYKARPANNNIIDVNNNPLTGNTLPLAGT
ncbi:MAG: beta strand repeat-containing protein, partial [bacterium]